MFKILYAEDDPVFQTMITVYLKVKLNAEIVTVENGEEALALYKKEDFGLVITDWQMPLMDGAILAKEIKKIDINQPVFAISTYPKKVVAADQRFVKGSPYLLEDLIEEIEELHNYTEEIPEVFQKSLQAVEMVKSVGKDILKEIK